MVGIAQAADFGIFMKKVGYSVGLESLYARAMDFGIAYSSVESFRLGDWTGLVRDVWDLRSEHVADVFSAFKIMKLANREPIAEDIGESLGIACRILKRSDYKLGARFLTLLTIISEDGDIFLNALAASFEKEKLQRALLQLISHKREQLFGVFSQYPEREAVVAAISIERQRSNRGSSAGGRLKALGNGRSLSDRVANLGLPRAADLSKIDIPSDDYLEKILVTRRGWAESLGLFSNNELTDAGSHFLVQMGKFGYAAGGGVFGVWPTEFEITRSRFDVRAFRRIPIKTTIDHHAAIFQSMGLEFQNEPRERFYSLKELEDFLLNIYREYRALSQGRSMIRNEVSLGVASATLHAFAYAGGCNVPDLQVMFEKAIDGKLGFVVRKSQTIEFAISVRRRENKPA